MHDKVLHTAAIVPAVAVKVGLEDAATDGKQAVVLGKGFLRNKTQVRRQKTGR